MQLKNRHCFRWCRINGVFLAVVALNCTAFPAVTGRTEELDHDYNYGLGKMDLPSQSPAQSLRFTLPLLISGDINAGGAFIFRFISRMEWCMIILVFTFTPRTCIDKEPAT